jgi:GNAT superfamily N-acetyltransferase
VPAADRVAIRALRDSDSLDELTALLHAAYSQLGRLGFNYTAVDQAVAVTRERIAGGECYVATANGALVGTVLLHRHATDCHWFRQPHVATIHQFGVLPAHQRGGVGSQLLDFAERRAVGLSASELALDTAEGAAHLIDWYARLGYRHVATEQWEGKTYRSVILSKLLQSSTKVR